MTGMLPEHDDDRFEEVLGRLDALVHRDQPVVEPPPVAETSIPVLTEVYQPVQEEAKEVPADMEALTQEAEMSVEEKLEQAVAAVLPVMVGILEDVLELQTRPAMESALSQAIADLRPQTEALLRQRLQQALASEKSQT